MGEMVSFRCKLGVPEVYSYDVREDEVLRLLQVPIRYGYATTDRVYGDNMDRTGLDSRQAQLEWVEEIFKYHAPTPEQVARMENLRTLARELAHCIMVECPASADRSAALRKLRECIMTANAAIVLDGRG